jgi:[calcium/calmodulin-dependent protein kinase] kinase
MAPEMLTKDKNLSYSGKAADVWSLGITFYAFTFLRVPFTAYNVTDLI